MAPVVAEAEFQERAERHVFGVSEIGIFNGFLGRE